MSKKPFLLFWTIVSFLSAGLLTAVVSEVGNRGFMALLPAMGGHEDAIVHVAATTNYSNVGTATITAQDTAGFADIFAPSKLDFDFQTGGGLSELLVIDHATTCWPHTQDGKYLPYEKAGEPNPSSPITVTKIEGTQTIIVKTLPLQSGEVYGITCTIVFPGNALNRTFVRRRLSVQYVHVKSLLDSAEQARDDGFANLDSTRESVDDFQTVTNTAWFLRYVFFEKIRTAEDVDIIGGVQPEVGGYNWESNHARELVGSDTQNELNIEWSDVRYVQLRDTLLVIIGGLFGLGLALFIEAIRPAPRSLPRHLAM